MSTPPVADVAVVGGGIVGTAAAALLAECGVSVVLYERDALAAGASGRNSGVVQRPFDPVLGPLYEGTIDLYRRLEAEQAGFVLGEQPAGLLLVSRDDGLVRAFTRHLAATLPEVSAETVEGATLRALEPELAGGLVACRMPIGFPVTPSSGTYAFATLAERHGARIRAGRDVTLALDGGRAVGVRMADRVERADVVIVAAGPWTPQLLDPDGRWRPIREQWGVVVEALLPSPPRHVMEEAELDAALGSPADPDERRGDLDGEVEEGRDSEVDAGRDGEAAAVQESGFSLVTAAGVSSVGSTFLDVEPSLEDWRIPLLERAASFVPAIADAPIRGIRACARPASADGRPLVGRVPWLDGCYVAAGHGPWGISTGPGSARLIVDAILGTAREPIDPAFDPGRFGAPTD